MPTLRIGVLSDTHGPLPESVFDLMSGAWSEGELNGRLWRQALCRHEGGGSLSLEEAVIGQEGRTEPLRSLSSRRCGLIAHCGDIGPQSVLDELGAIARTVAVLGNNDYERYWCSDGDVRTFRSFQAEGVVLVLGDVLFVGCRLMGGLRGADGDFQVRGELFRDQAQQLFLVHVG